MAEGAPRSFHKKPPSLDLLLEVRRQDALWKAWEVVFENGRTSPTREVNEEIKIFASRLSSNIRKLSAHLRTGKFIFDKATGIAAKKPGKKSIRPLVRAPLQSRIVQRALLDVLQQHIPEVRRVLNVPTSFGGVKDKGVPEAIGNARELIASPEGAYFIRSDISGFFKHIPREQVVRKLRDWIPNPEFIAFFEGAIKTELTNMHLLRQHVSEFPIHEIGVAQGNCLSPLIGNLFLEEFDKMMNRDSVITYRYIDDIIIFAPSESVARKAFTKAKKWLEAKGFDLYDPYKKGETKAEAGKTKDRFEFLGCEFVEKRVRPSKTSKKRLLDKLRNELIEEGLQRIKTGTSTFAKTVVKANGIMHGWAAHYRFCNDPRFFMDLDLEITAIWNEFIGRYSKIRETFSDEITKRTKEGLESVTEAARQEK